MQFKYRGDIISLERAIQVGLVSKDEFGNLWLRLDYCQDVIIVNIETEKMTEEPVCDTLKLLK